MGGWDLGAQWECSGFTRTYKNARVQHKGTAQSCKAQPPPPTTIKKNGAQPMLQRLQRWAAPLHALHITAPQFPCSLSLPASLQDLCVVSTFPLMPTTSYVKHTQQ